MIVSWNGRLVSEDELKISAFDSGLTRGRGVFETMLAFNGRIVSWPRHYDRLLNSARLLGIDLPQELALVEGIRLVLTENDLNESEARVRLTLSSNELITAVPLPERLSVTRVVTVDMPKNEKSPLAHAKTCSYAESMYALARAQEQGADEAILANTRGDLCEGAISNVFFVKDGELCTPALTCGCLPGTVRAALLEDLKVTEGHWPVSVLDDATEIWLSASTRPITWVSQYNDREMGPPSELFQNTLEELRKPFR